MSLMWLLNEHNGQMTFSSVFNCSIIQCLGLGTSSILAGVIMAALWRASGQQFDMDALNHAVCIPS